ncbi:MAG: PqqD family protein [Planctomycetes bacterium]|nr:PqqD family protein [Planctomycetota bacterium]
MSMTVGETEYRTSQHPTRRDNIVVCELDGEAVLYDERSGAVHRFNETALTVWKACDGSRSAPAIARIIAGRYALDSNRARTEVDNVIRKLTAKGLLLEASGAGDLQRDVRSEVDPPAQDPSQKPNDDEGESRSASRLPSRRELLRGGTAKLIYTAPLISTFFASGACASGPSASAAFGAGGCKTVGYSCAAPPDCCVFPGDGLCSAGSCCGFNGVACDSDADCCTPRTCDLGSCST